MLFGYHLGATFWPRHYHHRYSVIRLYYYRHCLHMLMVACMKCAYYNNIIVLLFVWMAYGVSAHCDRKQRADATRKEEWCDKTSAYHKELSSLFLMTDIQFRTILSSILWLYFFIQYYSACSLYRDNNRPLSV